MWALPTPDLLTHVKLKQCIPSRAGVPAVVGYLHCHHAIRSAAQNIPHSMHSTRATCYSDCSWLASRRSPYHVNVILHCKRQPAERLDVLSCCMEAVHSSGLCQHLQHRSLRFASCDLVSHTLILGGEGLLQAVCTINTNLAKCLEGRTAIQARRTFRLSKKENVLRQEYVSAISSTASAVLKRGHLPGAQLCNSFCSGH